MAPKFDTDFIESPWTDLIAEYGITAKYRSKGEGAGTDISVIYRENQTLPNYHPDIEENMLFAVVQASPDDVASPDTDDTFEINDVIWPVRALGKRLPLVNMQIETVDPRKAGGSKIREER